VRPASKRVDTAQSQALSATFRSYPVGEFSAARAVEHQPQGTEQAVVLEHPVRHLASRVWVVWVPDVKRRARVPRRVRTGRARSPESRGRLGAGGLDHEVDVLSGQGTQP